MKAKKVRDLSRHCSLYFITSGDATCLSFAIRIKHLLV
nr:unnamed protein product [Callosobruchus chinensis]